MAETNIGGINIRIGADTSGLSKGVADAKSEVGRLEKSLVGGAATAAKWGAAMATAAAAAAAAIIKSGMESIDAQAKLAQQLQTTYASMSALSIAAGLSGLEMGQVEQASKKLNVTLGQVASGGGEAAKGALDRLGLSATELAAMPVDQRIAAINAAIRETIPAAQQAAVASELFGQRAGAAMLMLNPDTMSEAARQAQIFGLALSDIDAAKVEMASDAMGTFGTAAKGITQQLTVQFAPILKAIGEEFLNLSEEAGGFGSVAEKVFNGVITGVGYVLDAIAGIKRVIQLVVDAGLFAFETLKVSMIDVAHAAVAAIDSLPGIDLSATVKSLAAAEEQSRGTLAQIRANMEATLTEPMPSEKLQKFVAEAQKSAQAAAAAAVEGRNLTGGDGETAPAVDKAAEEAARKKAEDEAKRIADNLARLEASYMTEQEQLRAKFEAEQQIINEALAAKQITQEQADMLELQAMLNHEAAMSAIQEREAAKRQKIAEAEAAAKQAILSKAFGGLSSLMNSESRKMFEVGKAAAIGQSLIATYTGMTEALKLGWPLGPAAAAAIGAVGFQNVQAIRAQQFGGGGSGARATGSNTAAVNAATQPVQQNQPTQRTNITLVGDVFSRESVIALLNSAMKDGFVLGT